MKILWIIYAYPPQLNGGAEKYTHHLNKYLIRQGHTVCVCVPPEYMGYKYTNGYYEGVLMSIADTKKERDALVEWSDVVMTHLDFTMATMLYIRSYRPVVWVSHNSHFTSFEDIKWNDNASIIYNCNKMKEMGDKIYSNNSMVLHPPISLDKPYSLIPPNASKHKYITLLNVSEYKGGKILKEIAKRLPNYSFLAVQGGYGVQEGNFPRNVKVVKHTVDVQKIYDQTRIILMPSRYESWGMVASEAMQNGIPVIASPCYGLEENLAWAGTYADLDNIEQWVEAIKAFDNSKLYNIKSEQGLKRSAEQRTLEQSELRECELWLKEIINKFKSLHNV